MLKQKPRVPTWIRESEAQSGVWGVKIKHKDAQDIYPWSPQEIQTNTPPNPRIKPQAKTQENSSKKHENHSWQEKEIDTTMNASIQLEVGISTKSLRKYSHGAKELGSSLNGWVAIQP
jgi:hypothetical protein